MKWLYWFRKTIFQQNGCKRICYFCSSYEECKNRKTKNYSLKSIDTKKNVVSFYSVYNKRKTKISDSLTERMKRIREKAQQDTEREYVIVLWVHKDSFFDVINIFGNYVVMFEGKDGHYIAYLEEQVDDKLLSFVISKGNKIRLLEPGFAVGKIIRMLEEARGIYLA